MSNENVICRVFMWALTLFFFFFTSLFNNLYIPSYSAKDALKSFEWSVTQLLLCSRCWQVLKRGIYFSFSGYQAHSKSTPLPKGGRLVVKCGTAFNTVESGTAAGTPGTFVVFFFVPFAGLDCFFVFTMRRAFQCLSVFRGYGLGIAMANSNRGCQAWK